VKNMMSVAFLRGGSKPTGALETRTMPRDVP
jgi:hypothetical protein